MRSSRSIFPATSTESMTVLITAGKTETKHSAKSQGQDGNNEPRAMGLQIADEPPPLDGTHRNLPHRCEPAWFGDQT